MYMLQFYSAIISHSIKKPGTRMKEATQFNLPKISTSSNPVGMKMIIYKLQTKYK